MRTAADGITAGEGEEVISQAGLQDFLWHEVPRKHRAESWRPVTEAAGVLLSLLGLDRYAAMARSSTTEAVLDAWERSPAEGFARFRAARSLSGVEPPDTNLLVWGGVMGMEEAVARQAVERALEQAVTAGDLRPGKGGWRLVAAEVCTRTLLARAGDGADRTVLQAVLDERVATWVQLASPPALKVWRERMGRRTSPDVQPSDVAAAVAPMRWLLATCAEGATLTQAGYLPPAVVREAAARFGWWEWPGQPRSEADVHQLGVLRQTAARLHLVSQRSRRLAVARRGGALANDAVGLWQAIAATLACEDGYHAMLSELVAHRLLDGPALDDALEREIGPIVAAQGWAAGGIPVTARQAGLAVHRALYHWRLFGLLDEVHARWEGGQPIRQGSTALNRLGRFTAIAFLRARATAPRSDLRA